MRSLLSACAFGAILAAPLGAQCDVTTLFAANNGGSVGGMVYLDLNVTQAVRITGISVSTTTAVGTPIGLNVFTRAGSYVGQTTSIANWGGAPVRTGTGAAAAANTPSLITLSTPLILTPGLYGVALGAVSFNNRYTNFTALQNFPGALYTITAGAATNTPFPTTAPFSPRVFNGAIHCTSAVGIFPAFAGTPTTGASPLAVSFTDQTYTSDPNGVTGWAWDFDGDAVIDSNAQSPSFTYNTCGRYSVSLTATDGTFGSASATRTNYIVVDPALLVSTAFSANVTAGQTPLEVTFTDTSTGIPSTWAWDFDGDSIVDSTAQNPSFTYNAGGSYAVTLTASNACGASTVTRAGYVACVDNDDCQTASALSIGLNGPFTNVGSTNSTEGWNCGTGGRDVWYVYRATQNAQVTVNLCTGTTYDSTLQAFVGTCGNPLVRIACNDDSCGLSSSISYPACRNEPVFLCVGGFASALGTFSIDIVEAPNASGSFTTQGTSCGGPTLAATGTPRLGEQVTYTMTGHVAIPFLIFGAEAYNGALCQAGCILGPLPQLAVYASTLTFSVPCDQTILGTTTYTQGLDLGALTGCGPLDPLLVALSETIVTVIG